MEAKVIIVTVEKSNKSENNVWSVAITGEEQKQAYCKSAYKAMRFAFMLKKQTGFYISDDSLKSLSEEIAKEKAAKEAAESEKQAEQAQPEQQAEAEQQPEAEPKKEKKARKPRTKKVQKPAAKTAELIAFL